MEYKKLEDIIEFNPTETLKKGTVSKKIPMDKLGVFSKYINSFDIEKYNGGMKFRNGDTLLARITPCLENGKTSKVTILDEEEVGFGSTEYIVMRSKKNISDEDFIFYLAISPRFREIAIKSMTGTSGRQRVQLDVVKNTEMLIPSYEEQIKIGKVLSSIDKRIELNNQINDNLFEFAINYINNKKEDAEVPLSNFAKIQGGYAFKSKDLLENKTNNRIIKIKNLRNEINADVLNSQFVEDEIANKIDNKFQLNKGDVAIAMTGAELGKTGFIYGFDKYYLNQRVGVIRGRSKEKELYLKILALSDEFQTLLNSKGYGSAQPNISSNDIENIIVNDITENNLKDIYEKLNSVYYKIIFNCEENLTLEQLRDTLLPKLMNGEIDLDRIEI